MTLELRGATEPERREPRRSPPRSPAEKIEMVLRLLKGETSRNLARETGTPRAQLVAWRKLFLAGGQELLESDGGGRVSREALREQIHALEARAGALSAENEQLSRRLALLESSLRAQRGRAHPTSAAAYARALESGETVGFFVPEWRTHVLLRPPAVPGGLRQASGLKPHASLDPASDLRGGLERLKAEGVASVSLVTDPLWCPEIPALQEAFRVCRPFRHSYIIDRQAREVHIRKRHRNRIQAAKGRCCIRAIALAEHLERWWALYQENVASHKIAEPFPLKYFETLAQMDAITTLAAYVGERIVTMTLWLRFDDIVYFHDGASSDEGHTCFASHAAFAEAIERFADCRFILFGGGTNFAGQDDGLAEFKRGFSNVTLNSHVCSTVLSRDLARA